MGEQQTKRTVTGRELKWIAVLSMTLDHIGAVLVEPKSPGFSNPYAAETFLTGGETSYLYWLDVVLRYAGRLAFPIFCFLLAEGFLHTRSRKRYALRLACFAVVSEFPYDMARAGTWFDPESQNVFAALFLCLALMEALARWEAKSAQMPAFFGGAVLLTGAFCLAAELACCDYGFLGPLLVSVLYLFRNDKRNQLLFGAAIVSVEVTAPLAFLLIRLYDGTQGKKNGKYFFYIYYPLHLLILSMVGKLVT